MSCRKPWTREVLFGNFSAKFVSKTLKERREELLFERERSLMPATQPWVEAEKKVRELRTKIDKTRELIKSVRGAQLKAGAIPSAVYAVQHNLATESEGRLKKYEDYYEYEKKVAVLQVEINFYDRCIHLYNDEGVPQERRQFVRACPTNGCKGFLSTAWKCGLCENWTCPDCHESRGPDREAPHTCDPNNVATAQLLAKDSRPCPKCASVIFKIDGCDQMFCTQCHVAFSWRRGTIETQRIHNPHYYEWMRANGNMPREPGDVQCGGMPHFTLVVRLAPPNSPLTAIYRMHMHVDQVVLPRYRINVVDDNRDLRIKFMIRDFTEEVFKAKLQQREKARQKKTEIRQVLEMYQAVTVDLFQALMDNRNCQTTLESFERLRTHVNDEMRKISLRYTNCAVPKIDESFRVF